jgi:LysM repeat protein
LTRPRLPVALAGLVTALLAAPFLATLTLAREPVVVRPGDTLTAISRRHGVSVETIVDLNGLSNPNRIYVGQRLRLEPAAGATADAAAAAPATADRTHVVRSGEHLTGIARRYGVTIDAIVAANRIADPSRIYAGQRLTLPGDEAAQVAPAPAAPATADRTHVVRSGEHLTGIARRYGVTIDAIVAANRIADPSRIYAGQRLDIPGTVGAAEGPPSPATAAPRLPATMARLVEERDAIRRLIAREAERHGVPAGLALALAWQESGWQQGVVSHAGAIGVMQLLPSTAEWVGDAMLGTAVDPHHLEQNVRAGVRLLAHYLDRYDGNRALALAAYYQGPTAVARHGIYPVTRPYIDSILVLERLFSR